MLTHTHWEADWNKLYKNCTIRSKLYYGSIVYRSARKSYVKILDPTIHWSLKLVLDAFKTSPVESLYAEADETPKLR